MKHFIIVFFLFLSQSNFCYAQKNVVENCNQIPRKLTRFPYISGGEKHLQQRILYHKKKFATFKNDGKLNCYVFILDKKNKIQDIESNYYNKNKQETLFIHFLINILNKECKWKSAKDLKQQNIDSELQVCFVITSHKISYTISNNQGYICKDLWEIKGIVDI